MRSSIFLFAGLSSTINATALPSEAPHRLVIRGEGDDQTGFRVPKGAPDGVYVATFENGQWTHHLVTEAADTDVAEMQKAKCSVETVTAPLKARKVLQARDFWIDHGCGGYWLNAEDTDLANWRLDRQCDPQGLIGPRRSFWSKAGQVVA